MTRDRRSRSAAVSSQPVPRRSRGARHETCPRLPPTPSPARRAPAPVPQQTTAGRRVSSSRKAARGVGTRPRVSSMSRDPGVARTSRRRALPLRRSPLGMREVRDQRAVRNTRRRPPSPLARTACDGLLICPPSAIAVTSTIAMLLPLTAVMCVVPVEMNALRASFESAPSSPVTRPAISAPSSPGAAACNRSAIEPRRPSSACRQPLPGAMTVVRHAFAVAEQPRAARASATPFGRSSNRSIVTT